MMIAGNIQIYRSVKTSDGATSKELIAITPLSMRYRVELACVARNVEAKEAGYNTTYNYEITDTVTVFQEGDKVKL